MTAPALGILVGRLGHGRFVLPGQMTYATGTLPARGALGRRGNFPPAAHHFVLGRHHRDLSHRFLPLATCAPRPSPRRSSPRSSPRSDDGMSTYGLNGQVRLSARPPGTRCPCGRRCGLLAAGRHAHLGDHLLRPALPVLPLTPGTPPGPGRSRGPGDVRQRHRCRPRSGSALCDEARRRCHGPRPHRPRGPSPGRTVDRRTSRGRGQR